MSLKALNPVKAADKGAKLHLTHPGTDEPIYADIDGKRVPAVIHLLGRDSKIAQDARKDIEKRRAAKEEISQEEAGIEVMAKLFVSWTDAVCIDTPGDLPFSEENARKLMTDPDTQWTVEQIGPFTMLRRNMYPVKG